MAGSVNKTILVGNLGRDPEVRTANSGAKIVNLSIATSELARPERERQGVPNGTALSTASQKSPSATYAKAARSISKASYRPASGKTRMGKTATQPKWCWVAIAASSPCWADALRAGRAMMLAAGAVKIPLPVIAAALALRPRPRRALAAPVPQTSTIFPRRSLRLSQP